MAGSKEVLQIAGREVAISSPEKVYFPEIGLTKLELVHYFIAVADGAVRGVYGRPMALKRHVNGITGEAFYQKRAPENRPEWIETVQLRYPSGGVADEIVVRDAAQLAWVVNLGCLDLHPHLVRAEDLEHPDELRVDLDPIPGVGWADVRRVALLCHQVLEEFGLTGWPKTSGSRGFHIFCRITPQWTHAEVRKAAYALALEVERRAPDIATAQWWKEERRGVFVDYNQNAKDHTTASQYSVRPVPQAWVSTPLHWDEVADCEPGWYTARTVPDRYAAIGDPSAGIDESPGSLAALLEHAAKLKVKVPAARTRTAPPGPPRTRVGGPTGRRRSSMPLIEIAKAKGKDEAMAGLDRWKARHPDVVPHLEPADILVDSMRGRSSAWYRIRVNLRHVPQAQRPAQEQLEVDYDPVAEWGGAPE
ncbi:MAG: DNA polymerase domain-containing protein [Micromonosporaceae bacterium]|nr:DNA polymerase domain-containing protein [Micromonosporaceae bacterium]